MGATKCPGIDALNDVKAQILLEVSLFKFALTNKPEEITDQYIKLEFQASNDNKITVQILSEDSIILFLNGHFSVTNRDNFVNALFELEDAINA